MPTVLVVDDSSVDRRLAGGLLERDGAWSVVYANDGNAALQEIQRSLPDLVLTDLQMPELNGLELVSAIKQDYPLVPVILMTAQGSEEIAAQALLKGAASYVPKRSLADDLVATVSRVWTASLEDRAHTQLMHYLSDSESVFVLPNQLELVHALVSHLHQMLRCMPLGDETERLRVGLALEEAMLNAYYHGNLEAGAALGTVDRKLYQELAAQRQSEQPYRSRRIHVSVKISRTVAEFVIRDEGPGFDWSRLPSAADLNGGHPESGRGAVLMRSIMDEVSYNAAGNEITLRKRQAPETIADLLDDDPE